MIVVRPGEIALIVAADGATMPSERVLGKTVPCDDFQDAEAFLTSGGERGRQLAMLTAGTYRINPALFEVVTTDDRRNGRHVGRRICACYQVQPERVGIVTTLDGRPIPAGDLAGPTVPGHDSFQRGQAFIDAGGCRGLQEQVLLSGSWNLNPWLVRVEQVPLVEDPDRLRRRRRQLRRTRAHRRVRRRIHPRRPGRARPQGRVGGAAAAGQAPAQHHA